ncbi:unnamed protein product [Boreogadus saida]
MEVISSFLSSTPSFSTSTPTITYSSTSTITYSSTLAYSSPITYSSTSIITSSSTLASSSIRPDRSPPATPGLIPDIPEAARDCLPDPCGRPPERRGVPRSRRAPPASGGPEQQQDPAAAAARCHPALWQHRGV